jgi:hypothetical protein
MITHVNRFNGFFSPRKLKTVERVRTYLRAAPYARLKPGVNERRLIQPIIHRFISTEFKLASVSVQALWSSVNVAIPPTESAHTDAEDHRGYTENSPSPDRNRLTSSGK